MRLRGDERGQSVQIGAVLLFAVLVVAFAGYQAAVVPQQNEQVEFDHSSAVQEDLRDLRTAVLASRAGGSARPTTVSLGTRYPARAVALNGPDPSGVLRTRETGDAAVSLAVDNATAPGEPGDAWDGSERSFDTGRITYAPQYNHYEDPPTTTYENTLLSNEFGSEAILLANQSFLDGRTIDLVAVNGSLYRTGSDATTVDVRPVSASSESTLVSAESPSEPVTIRFQSRHSPTRWRSILSGQPHVASVTESAGNGTADLWGIAVALDADEQYRLRLTKVGVGTRVAGEGPHYLDVGEDEGASVSTDAERRVSFVVRDRFDNPVSGVVVNASVGDSDSGTLVESSATSDEDGRATFTYRTSDSTATGTHEINGTLSENGVLQQRPFDERTLVNATLTVSVGTGGGDGSGGGSSGAYALSWKAPDATSGNGGAALSDCSTDACTWDVGGSSDATLDLNATTTPAFEGVGVEFAVNDSAVGTLSSGSGSTGSDGAIRNELTAQSNGVVDVLASANDDSDVLAVVITGMEGGEGGTSASQVALVQGNNASFWGGSGVSFDVRNTGSGDVTLTGFTLEGTTDGSAQEVSESQTGSYSQGQHEVFVDAATNGVLDLDGQPYYNDAGTPLSFGTQEPMTEDAVVADGGTATVNVYAFRSSGGNEVSMAGSTVTATLHFADGSSVTYEVQVP